MKELTIISGKGGTGKTTITSAFAHFADSAVVADADVDAADLHLILEPEVRYQEDYSGGSVAEIDAGRCTQCGACISMCRYDAISDFAVDPIACEGCRVCSYVCPEGAAVMRDRISGTWYISSTREGDMVHAKLGIAEDNSGKLVSIVRQRAKSLAEETGKNFIIVDGPPGIGCPVIASITGVDLVLVVTEPTLSGIHDMERVVATARHFKIPPIVCINKYDINEENTARIEELCAEQNVEIAGRIPYDKSVTAAMIHRKSVAEYDCGEVSRAVKHIWQKVMSYLDAQEVQHHA